jgi:Na+-translocating ferredoxin:NAD+ oxidoreductase RnfG subunit
MNEIARAGIRLALICVGSALILGLFSFFMKSRLHEASLRDVRTVLPSLSKTGKIGDETRVKDSPVVRSYFVVKDAKGKTGGFILRSHGEGWGGDFSLVSAHSKEGEVLALQLLENAEQSPAAGRDTSSAFLGIFIGSGGKKPVPLMKADLTGTDVDVVTGSTQTFLQLAKVLKEAAAFAAALGGTQ